MRTTRSNQACRVERADWLEGVASLATASVDLVYADPPFNTGQTRSAPGGSYPDAWPTLEAWLAWLAERLAATRRVLRPTASVLLHVDWRTSHRARCLLDEILGADRFVNHLVWAYGLGGSSPRRFARKHDDILFYCVDPAAYWFDPPRVPATSRRMRGQTKKATDVIRVPASDADNALADVLDVASINNMAAERTGYPTQKPLALLDLLVRACCPPGGLVLDPCCGSGTTLAAAVGAGRHAVGFDTNPDAVGLARRRLAQTGAASGATSEPIAGPAAPES
ncbi:MAG: site-specific DNA-methyltransferase [Phycisphaeraceae bacterium]|nr:site-specific DNA-methyltransferase [Phycisphaeraceae bacterium]